jgi:RHS repeat-associated protein
MKQPVGLQGHLPTVSATYDPFGDTLRSTGSRASANPWRFSTKYTDQESGWLYYGYRYYAPRLGRWVSRDPIGEWGGPAIYIGLNNNGLVYVDAAGLDTYSDRITERERAIRSIQATIPGYKLGDHPSEADGPERELLTRIDELSGLIQQAEHWADCTRFEFRWIRRVDVVLGTKVSEDRDDLSPQPRERMQRGDWEYVVTIHSNEEDRHGCPCNDVREAIADRTKRLPVQVIVTADRGGQGGQSKIDFSDLSRVLQPSLRPEWGQVKPGHVPITTNPFVVQAEIGGIELALRLIHFE